MIHYRIASKCPYYESVRLARGIEMSLIDSRSMSPRCNHCVYWNGGSCNLFLARGSIK